jgi:hypothetical protein
VRGLGRQLVALPNATWTAGFTTIVFDSDHGLSVGDYVAPTSAADWMSFRVTTVVSSTQVNVAYPWRGTTGSYTMRKVVCIGLDAAQSLSAANQTLTWGWKNDGTQPSDFISAFKRTANTFKMFTFGQAGTVVTCGDGRFRAFGYNSGDRQLTLSASCKLTGTVELSDVSANRAALDATNAPDEMLLDTILLCGGGTGANAIQPGGGVLRVRRAVLWNAPAWAYYSTGAGLTLIRSLELTSPGNGVAANGPEVIIGTLTANSNISLIASPGSIAIGTLTMTAGAATPSGNVAIGSPVALWRYQTTFGVCDKVTGRGGSGYGLRLDPNSALFPLEKPLATLADAGKSVTLSFWCYYSGNAGAGPTCKVVVYEPNGLSVVQEQTFTPPNGTSWANATQQTVTLTGTTAQKGSLEVALWVADNSAGDAVVYVDDVTWTGAGDQGDTSGLECHGLLPLVQKISAAGSGGVAFPLGL